MKLESYVTRQLNKKSNALPTGELFEVYLKEDVDMLLEDVKITVNNCDPDKKSVCKAINQVLKLVK
jgi:hypothetical protein